MANKYYTEIQDKVGQPRTETGKAVIADRDRKKCLLYKIM